MSETGSFNPADYENPSAGNAQPAQPAQPMPQTAAGQQSAQPGSSFNPADYASEAPPAITNGYTPKTAVNDPSMVLSLDDQLRMSMGSGEGKRLGNLEYLQNKFGKDNVVVDPKTQDPIVKQGTTWFHTKEQDPWKLAKDFVLHGDIKVDSNGIHDPTLNRLLNYGASQFGSVTSMGINAMARAGVASAIGLEAIVGTPAFAAVAAGTTAAAGSAVANAADAYMNNLGRVYGTYKADPEQERKDLAWGALSHMTDNLVAIGMMPSSKWFGQTVKDLGEMVDKAGTGAKNVMKSFLQGAAKLSPDASENIVEKSEQVGSFVQSLGPDGRNAKDVASNVWTKISPEVPRVGKAANDTVKASWEQGKAKVLQAIEDRAGAALRAVGDETVVTETRLHPSSAIANVMAQLQQAGTITVQGANGKELYGMEQILNHGFDGLQVLPGDPRVALKISNNALGDVEGAMRYSKNIVAMLQPYAETAKSIGKGTLSQQAEAMMNMRSGLVNGALKDISDKAFSAGDHTARKTLIQPAIDALDQHLKEGLDGASGGAYTMMQENFVKTQTALEPLTSYFRERMKVLPSERPNVDFAFFQQLRGLSAEGKTILKQSIEGAEGVAREYDPGLANQLRSALDRISIAHTVLETSPVYARGANNAVTKYSFIGGAGSLAAGHPGQAAMGAAVGAGNAISGSGRMMTSASTSLLNNARALNAFIGKYGSGAPEAMGQLMQNPGALHQLLSMPEQAVMQEQQTQQALQQQAQQYMQAQQQSLQQQQQMMQQAQGQQGQGKGR